MTTLKEKPSVSEPSSQPMDEPLSFQGANPPNVEPEEAPLGLSVVAESSRPNKGKSPQVVGPQVVEPTGDMPPPKIADEDADEIVRSVQDLFTSWEQVKTSCLTSTGSSSPSSITNLNFGNLFLKLVVIMFTPSGYGKWFSSTTIFLLSSNGLNLCLSLSFICISLYSLSNIRLGHYRTNIRVSFD
ncbi:uncharacterized protein LOC111372443 [Olea europaea var. sylvestris]|uniref:uncharacterized protein LOC111372443 n=1 Tax=Olea europaea var. sylvestris TaxID=158386 RepID=UPI000C1CD0D3|nr:uncharacterized protein LOC111372443 [Olea europaea var. sylvestris]